MPAMKTVLHPVTDVEAAKKVYGALLGVEPMADTPYYVGYEVAGVQIGLVPGGRESQGLTGAVPFWHVEDMDETVDAVTSAGGAVVTQPHEVGGGRLTALLTDTDGNQIGLIQDPRP